MNNKKQVLITILILLLTGISVYFSDVYRVAQLGSAVFGSLTLFLLPGYWLTKCFIGKIGLTERIAISFAVSVSLISLSAFFINFIGIPITAVTVLMIAILFISFSLVYLEIEQKL